MSKYSLDTKLQIVASYEADEGGYRILAKKYNISQSIIKRWIHNYQDFGIEGLQIKGSKTHYATETKLSAIECYLNTELSYREVGVKFGINNPSLIANWLRTFKKEGVDGLSKPKGRPSIVSNHTENKKQTSSLSSQEEISTLKKIIQEQEERIERLDIENQFLKELRRLREIDKGHQNNK